MSAETQLLHARPYPGMRPFDEDEDDLFFGQGAQIDALVERLGDARLIVVMGESGCGKSSLVKAGLIPKLRGGRVDPELNPWHTAVSRPAKAPIANLAEQLAAPGALGRPHAEIERQLYAGSYGVVDAVKDAGLPRGHRMLVVIDQFEELFRFTKEADSHAVARRDEASLFVKLLLGVTEVRSQTPTYVVLTMRSEYVGDCALFFGMAEAINRGSYLLPKMTRSQIEAAITGPLKSFRATIDNALLQTLLNENEAAQQDGLPLLQHALRRIWETASKRGDPVGLQLGDLTGVSPDAKGDLLIEKQLNEHLDGIYEGLNNDDDKRVTVKMLKQLGEYDNKGRLVRRSCDLDAVALVCGREPKRLLEIVNEFRKESLGRTFLMPPEDRTAELLNGDEPLDISHEALLRRWSKLREWIGDETKDADEFRALADRARKGSALLRGLELARVSKWIKRFGPSAPWSTRYAGVTDDTPPRPRYNYADAMAYFRRSQRWARVRWVSWVAAAVLVLAGLGKYADSRLKQQKQLEAMRQAHLVELQQANAVLDREKSVVEAANTLTNDALGKLQKANLEVLMALRQKTGALEEAQRASVALNKAIDDLTVQKQQAEYARNQAEEANKQAQAASDRAARSAAEAANARVEKQKDDDRLRAVDASDAEQKYRLAAGQPISYDPTNQAAHARDLVEAAKALRDSGTKLPADAATALYKALAMTRLSGNDHPEGKDSPVMFVYPDPAHPDKPIVLRQGASAKDVNIKEPRKGWTVERSIITSQGQIAYGGTGGYLSVEEPDRKPTAPRKMFWFALTGLGFSTDGVWVAMADSSSNMRIQRAADLASRMVITRNLTQFASGIKLVIFLALHGFKGEYPVRQWALSVPKNNPDGRRGISAAALTESGRLLTWERPGPIGKQLSQTDQHTVGEGHEFTAINTNPLTQEVWAASYNSLGKVVFGEPPTFRQCPEISRVTVSTMAWNDQGALLALGLRTGEVRVMAAGGTEGCGLREIVVFPAHAAAVTTAIWRGDLLATGSVDGSARVWNLALDKEDEALFRELRDKQTWSSFDALAGRILAKLPQR